jgi:1,2-diacylglycerol 3-beta-galactosyltransferase
MYSSKTTDRDERPTAISCSFVPAKSFAKRILLVFSLSAVLKVYICATHAFHVNPSYRASSLIAASIHRATPVTVFAATRVQTITRDEELPHTVQILISDTGGGHRASAKAIRDALEVLYPSQFICDIVDIYTDYGPFWPYNAYPACYKFMAKYPWMWDLFYQFGCTSFGMWLNELLLTTACYEPFKACLERPTLKYADAPNSASVEKKARRADIVVSVHPLCQDVPLKILAELDASDQSLKPTDRKKTPFVTIVSDLGSAHPTWFHPKVDRCYVPSDALYQAALNRKLHPSQIAQYGLPVREGFWSRSSGSGVTEGSIRTQLGLAKELPTVLVVGGGDGMGGLVKIAETLGRSLGEYRGALAPHKREQVQMVVVCGSNRAAREALEDAAWPSSVAVEVLGFVNNMDQYMKASDVLVTKAGPGTIAEASICGLPCMLFAYL